MGAGDPDRDPAQARAGSVDADALRREIRNLRQALARSETVRNELLSSASWRLAAPLRALRRLVTRRPVDRRVPSPSAPAIPAQLKRVWKTEPTDSNDTYRLLDTANATHVLRDLPRQPATRWRIAFVGGAELESDLRHDADVERLAETGCTAQLGDGRFDFLLLEPTWADSEGDWRYAMTRSGQRSGELRSLLEHARRLGLPIVLWFREDVRNYREFEWLCRFSDRAYGVSEDITRLISRDHPGLAAATLPPAIQPAVDNPIRSYALQEADAWGAAKVLVDGWWDLVRDQGRRDAVASLMGRGLVVCESAWEFGGVRINDLPEFAPAVLGCVNAGEKAVLNKLIPTEIFLPGGFRPDWQREQAMMRAAACGALVGSVSGAPSDAVAWNGSPDGIRDWLDSVASRPLAAMGQSQAIRRGLLKSHTVAHRLDTIARDLGLKDEERSTPATVAMILVTMRPQLLEQCLERYRRDLYAEKELVVVLHGDHDIAAARKLAHPGERISFLRIGSERSLGACLNRAIDASESRYWAKVDDDDLYGPNYLTDLMLGRQVVDYSIAGKPPAFAYLEGSDSLCFDPVWGRHAHLWHDPLEAATALVAGGTLVGKRELLDEVRFCERRRGGSDSDFIRRCYERGHGLAALDGFNFVRYRSAEEGFHTWRMDEGELLDRAWNIGGRGDVESSVFV